MVDFKGHASPPPLKPSTGASRVFPICEEYKICVSAVSGVNQNYFCSYADLPFLFLK